MYEVNHEMKNLCNSFSVNLADSLTCELPDYPSVEINGFRNGAVVLQYLPHLNEVAACGTFGKNDTSCHSLRPGDTQPGWQQMSPLIKNHCYIPSGTRSHFSDQLGWFVFGVYGTISCYSEVFSNEIYSLENEWVETPISLSPYPGGFPYEVCSVLINSSLVMITGGLGGDRISTAYFLNLDTFTWTEAAPLLEPRSGHGCVLTAEGEVLIAGGQGSKGNKLASVHLYNPSTNSWREDDHSLPDEMEELVYPTIVLWDQRPVLLESQSDRTWQRQADGNWAVMNASLGGRFGGNAYDTATLVPKGLYNCP